MKTPLNKIDDLLPYLKKIDRSRDQSLISLVAATGLFIDEIRHLSPRDINHESLLIQTTGTRPRTVSIASFAKPYLDQWLIDRPKSNHNALFISLTGSLSPLSKRGIDNIIRKWSDSINVQFNYQKLRTLSHVSKDPIIKLTRPNSSESFPPRGITYALAFLRSGLILTSVTVIFFVSRIGNFASSLKKIWPKDCFIISPTLNCL